MKASDCMLVFQKPELGDPGEEHRGPMCEKACGLRSWWNRGHWLKEVDFGTARYIGVDIVAPIGDANRRRYGNDARSFLHLDIVSDALPKADLVLCRDCLVHLSNRKAFQALRNLQASGSDYLATTTQQRSEKRGHHHGGVAAARPHVAALQFAETHHAH